MFNFKIKTLLSRAHPKSRNVNMKMKREVVNGVRGGESNLLSFIRFITRCSTLCTICMCFELNLWDGSVAFGAFPSTAPTEMLLAKVWTEMTGQFRINSFQVQLLKVLQCFTCTTRTAVVHFFGCVHVADVSEPVSSCKASGLFSQSAYSAEKDPILCVWRWKG